MEVALVINNGSSEQAKDIYMKWVGGETIRLSK
jgi:hypothetical protein